MTLENDRMKKTKIILPKGTSKKGLNMDRVDISGYDTLGGDVFAVKRKLHIGKKGGKFVVIDGKKRYLRT